MKMSAGKTPTVQRRQRFRIEVSFQVRYRVQGRPSPQRAQALDVSSGGMRIRTKMDIPLNTPLEIEFILPMAPLEILIPEPAHPDAPKAAMPEHMAPFGVLKAAAIAKTELPQDGQWRLYGLEFRKIQPFMRDELTRYIHLYQLAQLRVRRAEV